MHAYCSGRKRTTALPNVPEHFEFRAEVIDNIKDTVQFTQVSEFSAQS